MLVIASVGLALALARGLPVGAQEEAQDPTPGSSTTLSLPVDTNPTTSSTFLDTTSTSDGSTTSSTTSSTTPALPETTTTERRSVVTLPPTTSTTQLEEPGGPPSLPTTTSTPTPRAFDDGLSAGSIAALVIAALLAVALGLSLFLWWYLRRTAPVAETVSGTPG